MAEVIRPVKGAKAMRKTSPRSRSSKLTGGEGFTYEDLVVTYYLTALLREETAMGTRGKVVRVAVQQNRQGEPMDDLVVDAEEGSERARTCLQVKSNVVISQNDAEFKAIIDEAVATRKKPDFRVGRDRYGFVAETVAVGRFNGLSNIIVRAQASTNRAEFALRFVPGGESSKSDIACGMNCKRSSRPQAQMRNGTSIAISSLTGSTTSRLEATATLISLIV